jgi:hypothetical protein
MVKASQQACRIAMSFVNLFDPIFERGVLYDAIRSRRLFAAVA